MVSQGLLFVWPVENGWDQERANATQPPSWPYFHLLYNADPTLNKIITIILVGRHITITLLLAPTALPCCCCTVMLPLLFHAALPCCSAILMFEKEGNDVDTQYKSGLYFYIPEQEQAAIESRDRQQKLLNRKIVTEILPAKKFYRAEVFSATLINQKPPFGAWDYKCYMLSNLIISSSLC